MDIYDKSAKGGRRDRGNEMLMVIQAQRLNLLLINIFQKKSRLIDAVRYEPLKCAGPTLEFR